MSLLTLLMPFLSYSQTKASDAALLDVVTGKAKPEGRLPFELPSSMQEVEAQRSDVPHDTRHPLYPFGFGRQY